MYEEMINTYGGFEDGFALQMNSHYEWCKIDKMTNTRILQQSFHLSMILVCGNYKNDGLFEVVKVEFLDVIDMKCAKIGICHPFGLTEISKKEDVITFIFFPEEEERLFIKCKDVRYEQLKDHPYNQFLN